MIDLILENKSLRIAYVSTKREKKDEKMKVSIEEKDEIGYRPVPLEQLNEMVKLARDKVVIYVPNLCGGMTRITLFKSECPEGNIENLARLSLKYRLKYWLKNFTKE